MKVRHWYVFNRTDINKLDKSGWNALRNDKSEKEFSIEEEIKEYELNCEKKRDYALAAERMISFLEKRSLYKIASMGVGKGILEWHLKKKMPSLQITCTDYTETSLKRLQEVFPRAEKFAPFDMVEGNWKEFNKYDSIVLFRVSTEFNVKAWRGIFLKCYNANINRIIFCPTGVDTWKEMAQELKNHYINKIRKRQDTFCGWLYTENEFYKMWKELYYVEEISDIGFSKIYFLKMSG